MPMTQPTASTISPRRSSGWRWSAGKRGSVMFEVLAVEGGDGVEGLLPL